MLLSEIVNRLELTVYCGTQQLNRELTGAYVSDLLSDVMGHATEGQCWITMQSHINVVAVACLKELSGVILVKNIQPDKEMIRKANLEGLTIMGTSESTFITSGKLYDLLIGNE